MTNAVFKAALWMTGAIVSFTAMAVAGRTVSVELDTFETMLYRSLAGFAFVFAFGAVTGRLALARTGHFRLHVLRNLAHFSGQNLWFFAITVIPLAQVFALEFTTPIWAILLSAIFLGERLTRIGAISALFGFAGAMVVARPDVGGINAGILTAALAAVCFGATAVATRRLTRTENIYTIMFYLTSIQLVFGLVCAGIDGDIALPSAANVPWVLVIAAAGLLAHFCLTTALSLAPASIVMPIDFVRLPVIATVGVLLYDEPLQATLFVGAVMIFAANYINLTAGKPAATAPD